jgi:hypothetical protein
MTSMKKEEARRAVLSEYDRWAKKHPNKASMMGGFLFFRYLHLGLRRASAATRSGVAAHMRQAAFLTLGGGGGGRSLGSIFLVVISDLRAAKAINTRSAKSNSQSAR